MNASLPVGHRDPRTEMVPSRYLHLAAKLIADTNQDLDYWNTVKVPQPPSDRLAFEELRQVAVFLPLALVVLAYVQFGFIGAPIAFICALPLMKALNDAMQRATAVKRNEWLRRDAGRYAFTHFMCKEFDLNPEDVTMKLVLKMSSDFRQWLAVATRLRSEEAEHAGRSALTPEGTFGTAPVAYGVGKSQAAAGFVSPSDALLAPEIDSTWSINPATGLPMMSSSLDIHGNVFGMDNMDSLFNNMGDVAMQQEGFNPGVNDFG